MKSKFRYLELSRGIAALMVTQFHGSVFMQMPKYFHATPWYGLFRIGSDCPVTFFFVLSGFIMLRIHRADIGASGRLGNFVFRRVWRIYPLYWLVTLVIVSAFFIIPSFGASVPHRPIDIFRSLLLLPGDDKPILRPAWTLQHEMLFYGMFALMILHFRFGIAAYAVWQIALLFVNFSGLELHSYAAETFFDLRNILFTFGMLAAIAVRHLPPQYRPLIIGIGTGMLFLLCGCDIYFSPVTDVAMHWFGLDASTWLYGTASALMITGFAMEAPKSSKTSRLTAFMLWCGAVSYPLYLVHEPCTSLGLKLALKYGDGVPLEILQLCIAGISVITAAAVTYALDAPLKKLGSRLQRRLIAKRPALAST